MIPITRRKSVRVSCKLIEKVFSISSNCLWPVDATFLSTNYITFDLLTLSHSLFVLHEIDFFYYDFQGDDASAKSVVQGHEVKFQISMTMKLCKSELCFQIVSSNMLCWLVRSVQGRCWVKNVPQFIFYVEVMFHAIYDTTHCYYIIKFIEDSM